MKKIILILSVFLCVVFIAPPLSHALRIAEPMPAAAPAGEMPIEHAVMLARQYIAEHNVDISKSYLAKAEYLGLHDAEPKPYWVMRWELKEQAKGGWFDIRVDADGAVTMRLGE